MPNLNRFFGSKVMAILVNGGILPSAGVSSGRVCTCNRIAPATPCLLLTCLLRRLQAQTVSDAAPPRGKIHPFSKIAVTFQPVMRFGWKHHLQPTALSLNAEPEKLTRHFYKINFCALFGASAYTSKIYSFLFVIKLDYEITLNQINNRTQV